MIEHAQHEDEVEGPERCPIDFLCRQAPVLDLRLEHVVRQQKPVLAELIPRKRIDGQHARGAAPFALEGEEAIPRADVEDGFSREVRREIEKFQSPREPPAHVPFGPGRQAAEIEGMAPLDGGHAGAERLFVHGRSGSSRTRHLV